MTSHLIPTTCTVIVGASGERCGLPAVTTFTSRRTGETFAECAAHAPAAHPAAPVEARTALSLGIRTATTHAYVLVARGRVVGYAASKSPAVMRRAARLGAEVLPPR